MDRSQIVETTYEAMLRLNRIKGDFGVISRRLADAENLRLESARELTHRIDELVENGDLDAIAALKPQIDRTNMSAHTHWEELKLPVGLTKVRFLRSLWAGLTGR